MAEPTVIDSLVVVLGLDPKDFNEGRKKSAEDLLKWRSGMNDVAKDAAVQGKKAGEFFGGIKREALGLFAVVAGSKGLESFTTSTVTNLAAIGRTAQLMGLSVSNLTAFQNLIVRSGGSADHAKASLQGLSQAMEQWKLTGNTPMLPWLNRIGASANDDALKVYEKFAAFAEKNKDRPKYVQQVGLQLGLDEAEVTQALKGAKQLAADMQKSRDLGVPDEDRIKKVTGLQAAFFRLRQGITGDAQAMVGDVAPFFTQMLGYVSDGIEKFPELTKAVLVFGAAMVGLGAVNTAVGALGLIKAVTGGAAGAAGGAAAGAAATTGAEAAGATLAGVGGGKLAAGAAERAAARTAAARLALIRAVSPFAAVGGGIALSLIPTDANVGEADALARAKAKFPKHKGTAPGTDLDYAVRTLIGEARAGDVRGQMDVAHVIKNRMARTGKGAADIVLQHGQFEPWGDPQTAARLMAIETSSAVYQRALQSWLDATKEADPTKGATLFVSPQGQAAKGRKMPAWADAKNETLNREGHEFFTGGFPGGARAAALAEAPTVVNSNLSIGQLTIQTQATDAAGVARDLPGKLRDQGLAVQANTGLF